MFIPTHQPAANALPGRAEQSSLGAARRADPRSDAAAPRDAVAQPLPTSTVERVAAQPAPVDKGRVETLRNAILTGSYRMDAERTAEAILNRWSRT